MHGGNAGSSPPAQMIILKMIANLWIGRALTFAARAGIADLLREGPKSAAELSTTLGYQEEPLYRTLRVLTVNNVFAELPGRRFALTPVSELLRSDVQGSSQAVAAHFGFTSFWHAMAEIDHTMRTGAPSFDEANGKDLWAHLRENGEEAAVFNRAMTATSAITAEPVAKAYDFTGIRTLVDVGGGHGALLAAILARNPEMRGVLFDLPEVVAGAPASIEVAGLSDRITIQPGTFFEGVPAGGDAYIMKSIIHDWDDARSLEILASCRRAMEPEARLLLVEMLVTDGLDGLMPKVGDLGMMLLSGGKERTAEEFGDLLSRAGFRMTRVVLTESFARIIEAEPA